MSEAPALHASVVALQGRAAALLGKGSIRAIALDPDTFAKVKTPAVLIAIHLPSASVVFAVDRAEFESLPGVEIARLMGASDMTARDIANMKHLAKLAGKR